ncbi:hypothetical protein B0J13DRAFT_565559 [Dactylonectria estremocensis]|uniref:Uncharacterized protein n=1 Tax=Dactylonectria estremocensis TaxID=1079267 RepID=A0A9P9DWD5_9HYPO|nr:hypothetical protein B0J13DRAFT_565559 [Dactylonectria estremocensis]
MFVPSTSSRPPTDIVIPYNEQLIFTVATQIPFAIFFSLGIRNLISHGDPKALLFGIGGVLSSAYEPIVDVMGFCFFPREGNWIAFEAFGRPIPVFVPATYGWYVGGMGYWFYTVIQNPKTTQLDVQLLWFRAFFINLVLEYPPLYIGVYIYYGFQPLEVGGFPLWFPAVHAASPVLAATVISLITPRLKGLNNLVIVPATFMAYGMANAGFGAPVWLALSVDVGYHATYPAVAATALLIYSGIWIMSLHKLPSQPTKFNGVNGKAKGLRG